MSRPVLLLRLYIAQATQNLSSIPVHHPTREYVARVLRWGRIDRSIPAPSGLIQIGDAAVELADTDGSLRTWFGETSPIRRLGEFRIGEEGGSEAAFQSVYTGEIKSVKFGPGTASVQLRDVTAAWLDDIIPKLGTKDNFPNQPVGQDEFFWPILFGRIESPAVDDPPSPQGQMVCHAADMALNRYAIARHDVHEVIGVYRLLAGETSFSLVDSSEYELVTEDQDIDGITYTFSYLQFGTAQAEGTVIQADISGVNYRGAFGAIGTATGELRNPVDHIINLVYYVLLKETRIAQFNVPSFSTVRALCASESIYSDGAIVETMTAREALSQICASADIDLFVNNAGAISVALTLSGESPLPVLTDLSDFLRGTVQPSLPEETYNRFHYRFGRNYAANSWNWEFVVDNLDDQAELSPTTIQELLIELPFVRDEDTATLIVSDRARYYTLRSYKLVCDVPLPERIADIDIAQYVGITHFGGIGDIDGWSGKPFKVTGLTLDLDDLRMSLQAVYPPPPSDLSLASSWSPGAGHTSGNPYQPGATNTADGSSARIRPSLFYGTEEKLAFALTTDFLKEDCIVPSLITVGSPATSTHIVLVNAAGNYGAVEAAWVARALISKNGTGERALAASILDLLATIQNADGSWYTQYKPQVNSAATGYDRATAMSGPSPLQISGYLGSQSSDFKSDLAVASVIYAMADYDIALGSTRYLTTVRQALNFLRDLQFSFQTNEASNLLSNAKYQGTIDDVAIIGNSALALLAMLRALTAYSAVLHTSPGNYAVSKMANDLYFSLTVNGWAGDAANYYHTTFPVDVNSQVPIQPFKQKLVFVQALCAMANYLFKYSAWWDIGGAGDVDTSGTAVTRVSGVDFNYNGSWEGNTITINGVNYVVSSVADADHLTLTASAGTQAGVSYAVVASTDHTGQAVRALDFILPLCTGQWGGHLISPFYAEPFETFDEHVVNTSLLVLAMNAVDASKYSEQIAGGREFLQWMALASGQVFGHVDKDSLLWKWKSSPLGATVPVEGYGWLSLPIATGLLAGA